jgi:hypothetical protein
MFSPFMDSWQNMPGFKSCCRVEHWRDGVQRVP